MAETAAQKDQVLDQFTQQAESYSRLTGAMAIAGDRQAAFRALVDPRPDDLALDVCCGPATIALDLAPHVARVTGLDLTPAMLDQARAAQAEKGMENADWVEGDVCALPFEDGAFSIVLCGAAFHHLTDPRAAFAEMARVCRPGGRIVIRDVTPAADKSAAYDAFEKARDPSHVHALTPEEVGTLGLGLPVDEPTMLATLTPHMAFDPILATSFPQACTIEDLRERMREDALTGEDRLGFSAQIVDGEVRVAYPGVIARWVKN